MSDSCNPMDCRSPGSSIQARILEWVYIPFSRGSSWPRDEPGSLALQADSLPLLPPGKPHSNNNLIIVTPCSYHLLDEANGNMHKIHFNTYTVPYINIFIHLLSTDLPYATETPVNLHTIFFYVKGALFLA